MKKPAPLFHSFLIGIITAAFTFVSSLAIAGAPAAPSLAQQIAPVASTNNGTPSVLPIAALPPAPILDAKGYVLMDANSGTVLASQNANTLMPPASLTKLMTLYLISNALASGELKPNTPITISKDAWSTGGSRMFIQVGNSIPANNLIQGIIVASGNDAAMAMAEYLGGTIPTFIQMMNQTAKRLGMANTHYTDPTGLPAPDHYSTPYDIALLARSIINDFPQYYPWYKQKWITFNKIKQPNRNRLLWRDPSVDGLKTGHTDAAGFCLVASANRNNMRLIAVVMGTPSDSSRTNDAEALLNYGYRFFSSKKLYSAQTPLKQQRVWFGQNKYVALGVSRDLYVTAPTTQINNVTLTLNFDKELTAPVYKNNKYGEVVLTNGKNMIGSYPLVALSSDPLAGWWSRLTDRIALLFHRV